MKPIRIGATEYIVTEGEYAAEMYFIRKGRVDIVLREFNNFPFITVEKGYYFGEVDLLLGETRKFTFRASEETELLALSKKDFTKIFIQEFKDIGAEIYHNALRRRVKYLKTQKEAIEYCKVKGFRQKPSFKSQKTMISKDKFNMRRGSFQNLIHGLKVKNDGSDKKDDLSDEETP